MNHAEKTERKIPLVDLKSQYRQLKTEILASLSDVLETSSFVRGPKVQAFEDAFAKYHQASCCVAVNSGTDALFLLLKALKIKPNDEIITVPFTFIATAEAIQNAGAKVKFVDVDPQRYTLDSALLEEAIGPKTVGIIPVHLYGMPAQMEPILAVAKKHHLWVIEDACQAHGALYQGKKVGTLGVAGAFSFYPSKNLGTYGDGGAVITNDAELARKLRMLRDHGQSSKYCSELVGYNSRLDAFQAAILSVKLPHLDEWNQKRRTIASWYQEILQDIKELSLPKSFPDSIEVFHLYAIRALARDCLATHLQNHGIATAVHYIIPVHQQPSFMQNGKTSCYPVSERLSREILSLPMYPELTRDQVEYVGEKIKEFFA